MNNRSLLGAYLLFFIIGCSVDSVSPENEALSSRVNKLALMTKSIDAELIDSESKDTTISYLAVEFFPQNTRQLFSLINLEGIMVSYTPFNADSLPEKAQPNLERGAHIGIQNAPDGSINHSCFTPSECNPLVLPIIYALWPEGQALPDSISYVLRPENNYYFKDIPRRSLVNEFFFPLYVRSNDNLLGYLPMKNLKIRMSYNGLSTSAYTNDNGYVLLAPVLYNVQTIQDLLNVHVSVILETPKWIIARDSLSIPISIPLGTIGELWGPLDFLQPVCSPYYANISSSTTECEVHRAVDYYFNSAHDLSSSISSSENGIVIYAQDTVVSYTGKFVYGLDIEDPYIIIFNTMMSQNWCIGAILHELGHMHHYYKLGGNVQSFDEVSGLIAESYASFVGWLLGVDYYVSKGYTTTNIHSINYQGRQAWTPENLEDYDYSPLFIDLVDNYNQPAISDVISAFPITSIEYMAGSQTTIAGVKGFLYNNYINLLYTQSEIETQLSYY